MRNLRHSVTELTFIASFPVTNLNCKLSCCKDNFFLNSSSEAAIIIAHVYITFIAFVIFGHLFRGPAFCHNSKHLLYTCNKHKNTLKRTSADFSRKLTFCAVRSRQKYVQFLKQRVGNRFILTQRASENHMLSFFLLHGASLRFTYIFSR